MDSRTDKELRRITQNIPKHLQKVTYEVIDTTEEDMMKDLLSSGKLNSKKERKIKELIESGSFRRSETVVDEKVVKELDRYHHMMIAKAKAQGKLGDPNTDRFLQERARRLKAIQSRKK